MADFFDGIKKRSVGAWVVHHSQKTAGTVNGAAEFPALDTAGKAASLLSQLAASDQLVIERAKVEALGKAAGLSPRLELPALLGILEEKRLLQRSSQTGDVEVLGLTSSVTVQHAADIFSDQDPSAEEKAAIALSEISSEAPLPVQEVTEFISDTFKLARDRAADFVLRSETVGFVDAEGSGQDKLLFNGNLFRRDNLTKVTKVLGSLSDAEKRSVTDLDSKLTTRGCISLSEAESVLSSSLLSKLRAAGVYDVNYVSNAQGEFGFVTRPSAFHKFNDPLVDDAFDLAKALVAALSFGMTQSSSGRGRIDMIGALLGKLIKGYSVGPATAIGEDYRVLETKGVIKVTKAAGYGYTMRLLKRDIGEMALNVLITGETAVGATLDRPLPGKMTGFTGPEKSRAQFRRKQDEPSKRLTQDVLEVLRTKGTF
jgi:hypothetical protein